MITLRLLPKEPGKVRRIQGSTVKAAFATQLILICLLGLTQSNCSYCYHGQGRPSGPRVLLRRSTRNCDYFAESPLPATATPALWDPRPVPDLCLPLRWEQMAQWVGERQNIQECLRVGGKRESWRWNLIPRGYIIRRGGKGGGREITASIFSSLNLLQVLNLIPLSTALKLSQPAVLVLPPGQGAQRGGISTLSHLLSRKLPSVSFPKPLSLLLMP